MRITSHDAIRMAAAITGCPVATIRGLSRSRKVIHVRAAVAVLMHRRGLPAIRIGVALNRDHTCILNYIAYYGDRQEVQDLVDLIEKGFALNPPWHCRAVQSLEAVNA